MSDSMYRMIMPGAVYSGIGALDNLKKIVSKAGKVAVFSDKGLVSRGLAGMAIAKIKESGRDAVVISDLQPEPSYLQVQELVDEFKQSGCDFIVALGGGSVMDTAKLASLLASGKYTVQDLLENPALGEKTIPTCMIPSTAGTGAEATQNAIVAVPERELKVGIVNPAMVPDYVILDAEMVKSVPRNIAASTGIDAMSHAIECFTGNKANPFSDMFALEAFDLILNNIERACDDPEDLKARNMMQIAAFYGGMAIASSGTTAVHALSYPLGGKYHIAHGVSNAMLLVPVMKFNEPAIRERLAMAYDRVVHGAKICESISEKSRWIIRRMDDIVRHLDIPASLEEFGIAQEDLDSLVDAGMQVKRLLANNMREVTAEDARDIYQQIM